jgi:hypothetical protein
MDSCVSQDRIEIFHILLDAVRPVIRAACPASPAIREINGELVRQRFGKLHVALAGFHSSVH